MVAFIQPQELLDLVVLVAAVMQALPQVLLGLLEQQTPAVVEVLAAVEAIHLKQIMLAALAAPALSF